MLIKLKKDNLNNPKLAQIIISTLKKQIERKTLDVENKKEKKQILRGNIDKKSRNN